MKKFKIAVAGTGYVGLSLSVLLAQHNQVMAVDIVQAKVDMINNHKSPMLQEFYQGKQLEIVCFMRSDDLGKIPEVYPDFKFRCHILNIYNPLSWLSVYKEIKECTCVFDGSYGGLLAGAGDGHG